MFSQDFLDFLENIRKRGSIFLCCVVVSGVTLTNQIFAEGLRGREPPRPVYLTLGAVAIQ